MKFETKQLGETLPIAKDKGALVAGALQTAIFNSASFSSIATDEKGVIQVFNVGAECMLGYSAAEVMNKITPADISDPQEVIARAEALSLELATPIKPGFEALVFKASRGIEDIYALTYIRKDGTRFPAMVSVTALRDDQNDIIGYLLIGADNTARKQAEEERSRLHRELRAVTNCNQAMMRAENEQALLNDVCGIICAEAGYRMACVGYAEDDEAKTIRPVAWAGTENGYLEQAKLTWADTERGRGPTGTAIRSGDIACIQDFTTDSHAAPWRAGALRQSYRSSIALPLKDEAAHTFGVLTIYSAAPNAFPPDEIRLLKELSIDLAFGIRVLRIRMALKQNNVELENAKSLAEKANLAKSDFLSGMSHELRSPLNAILGFAQLMESDYPPPTPSQLASISQILEAGWYLLALINEILDLAIVESGKMTLSMEPVSLAEVMLDIRTMMEPQAQKRGILMTFPRLDAPCFVHADRTRLKQVLINILSNATKYNREGGTIVLESDFVAPGRVRISIRDTGMGLPPEKVELLFQSFNRLGQETSAEEGTGIGLVMSKRLVELMDGAIGVESTVGVGSVFWIELNSTTAPTLPPEEAQPEAIAQVQSPNDVPLHSLLYVEDNPANLKLVEQLIARHADLRLLSAEDANVGIALARASQPDVILMDINLPGISGIEALAILRKDPATAHIPIVAISANAMPHDIEKGIEVGFFRYLTKPIRVKEFEDTLNVALAFAEEERSISSKVSSRQANGKKTKPEADASGNPAETPTPLPDELTDRLREAAMRADNDQLLMVTNEVERYDERKSQRFKHYVDTFDYQGLLDAIQTGG